MFPPSYPFPGVDAWGRQLRVQRTSTQTAGHSPAEMWSEGKDVARGRG